MSREKMRFDPLFVRLPLSRRMRARLFADHVIDGTAIWLTRRGLAKPAHALWRVTRRI